MIFSIDTSVLINGWYKFYPPDLFPSYWNCFDSHIGNEMLIATIEVLHELEKQHDDLLEWCKERRDMFIEIDNETQIVMKSIMSKYGRLTDTRSTVSPADAWVIALAQTKEATVVTEEEASGSLTRIRIPDVCLEMSIPCINTVGMMRTLKWRFP